MSERPEEPGRLDRGHSIWLVADEETGARVEALEASLRDRHGGPRFPPHLTVCAKVEAEADARQIAEAAALSLPLVARFDRIRGQALYFRNLYLRPVDDAPFATLRDLALREVPADAAAGDEAYMPHVSLHYGNLGAAEQRTEAERLNPHLPLLLRFDRAVVMRILGDTEEWKQVAEASASVPPGAR